MATSPVLSSIAQVLDGDVRGNSVHAATPGHSKHDRGTVITLDPDAPDGCLVHSFNGGDPLAIAPRVFSSREDPSWPGITLGFVSAL